MDAQPLEFVAGIDPSLCATGICAWRRAINATCPDHWDTAVSKPRADRIARYNTTINYVLNFLPLAAGIILIEGYGFACKGRGHFDLAEFGGVLRYRLSLERPSSRIAEVPPSKVKLFCAGKGNADKRTMSVAAFKRWNCEFDDDNQCDAYVLCRMAAVLAGWEKCETDFQTLAMGGVKLQ